jgi:hypothetical protein
MEGQVPLFISPRNRIAQLYLQALGLNSCPINLPNYTLSARTTRKHNGSIAASVIYCSNRAATAVDYRAIA